MSRGVDRRSFAVMANITGGLAAKRASLIVVMLAVTALAGCKNTHSVDWYKAHATERLAKLKQCEADPGELQHTPNCVNATKAEAELSLGPRDDTSIPRLGGPSQASRGQ